MKNSQLALLTSNMCMVGYYISGNGKLIIFQLLWLIAYYFFAKNERNK